MTTMKEILPVKQIIIIRNEYEPGTEARNQSRGLSP